ncbi:hypothetical protein [Sinosporangium siamense]|uniref:Uncharacterized protein n=1 Tax=Sinosporangium siamense TaxID=1367973 RepID=A0A919RR36_9ACTN|nr:hypothetical protein [Sinosporangium siamense]GII97505.1 hypothetical protein Ssi02_77360 [Sinosporangium siamense]
MKFVLELDMTSAAFKENPVAELGRVLRYWGGNIGHYEMAPGSGEVIYDSNYHEVGKWSITS